MASDKLDKSKPYGEVFPPSEGRRYSQDGKYYDANGNLWVDPKAKKPEPPKQPKRDPNLLPLAAKEPPKDDSTNDEKSNDDQVKKQLAGA